MAKESHYLVAASIAIGAVVPDLEIATSDGRRVSLRNRNGRLLLLNFYAPWCNPCTEELQHFNRDLVGRFPDDSFEIVSVGVEESMNDVVSFKNTHALQFPMAPDADQVLLSMFMEREEMPTSVPANCIIGTDGRLKFRSEGYTDKGYTELLAVINRQITRTEK